MTKIEFDADAYDLTMIQRALRLLSREAPLVSDRMAARALAHRIATASLAAVARAQQAAHAPPNQN
jgi:hypothetical protein